MDNRGKFTSNFGFIMAAVGSAVGLGNLWAFPYKLGANGGFAFLLIYIIMIFLVGFILIIAELAIGRKTKLNPVGAFRALNKKFAFAGWFGIVAAFLILSFYSVLGGWSIKYFFTYIMDIFGKGFGDLSGEAFFNNFISDPVQPLIFTAMFIGIIFFISIAGVEKGIEKSAKIMMPMLFFILVIVIIRSVTLPNAMEGIKFIFKPDFSFLSNGKFGEVIAAALSQMFFSLSLGMGAMITYGSYLKKDANIEKNAILIPLFDTLIAVMAAIAIMPAVFSFNLDPAAGPGLLFVVLREVFASIPFGDIFGAAFFLLVIFAAVTSGVSLLEVVSSYFIDEKKFSRKKSASIVCSTCFALGIPVSLGFGLLKDVKLPQLNGVFVNILDFYDYVGEYVLMTLGAFILCIVVAYVIKPKTIVMEVEANGNVFKSKKYWCFMMKFITPLLVLLTFLTATGILNFQLIL
ncbi:MAG: sodium-dependent transporter [Clostridia bacterium]